MFVTIIFVYRNALRHAFYILATGKHEDKVSMYFVMCTCICDWASENLANYTCLDIGTFLGLCV